MAVGLGTLRLAPSEFWAMTLCELDAALRGAFGLAVGAGALRRTDLDALMAAHPDARGL